MAVNWKGKRLIVVKGERFLWEGWGDGAHVIDLKGRLNVVCRSGRVWVKGPRFRAVKGCGGLHRCFKAPDFFFFAANPAQVADLIGWATHPGRDPEELNVQQVRFKTKAEIAEAKMFMAVRTKLGEYRLGEHQHSVAHRVLMEERRRRSHLVVSLSGAHAYGFPSPDSDLDLKAVHIDPTRVVLGLEQSKTPAQRVEVIDGVEIDYSSNEIQPVLTGILQGNGNYIERILGTLSLESSDELATLRPLVSRALSRQVYRHYLGFATSQLKEFQTAEAPTAKSVLYVLRTALTGAHLLRTGEMAIDLTDHLDRYGFGNARELINAKRAGERTALSDAVRDRWLDEIKRAFAILEEAHASSTLPEQPENRQALNDWLIELRRARF